MSYDWRSVTNKPTCGTIAFKNELSSRKRRKNATPIHNFILNYPFWATYGQISTFQLQALWLTQAPSVGNRHETIFRFRRLMKTPTWLLLWWTGVDVWQILGAKGGFLTSPLLLNWLLSSIFSRSRAAWTSFSSLIIDINSNFCVSSDDLDKTSLWSRSSASDNCDFLSAKIFSKSDILSAWASICSVSTCTWSWRLSFSYCNFLNFSSCSLGCWKHENTVERDVWKLISFQIFC